MHATRQIVHVMNNLSVWMCEGGGLESEGKIDTRLRPIAFENFWLLIGDVDGSDDHLPAGCRRKAAELARRRLDATEPEPAIVSLNRWSHPRSVEGRWRLITATMPSATERVPGQGEWVHVGGLRLVDH